MGNTGVVIDTKRQQPPMEIGLAHEQPPVLILNMFYSGLGIARDMAGHNIRVVGLSAHHRVYGNFTRLSEVRFAPNSQEQPERLLKFLLEAAHRWQGAVIFPTRDADVLFLDRFRGQLRQHYRLAIPPHEVLLRVIDKHALAQAAAEADVPVPRTTMVHSRTELARVSEEIGLPCVVKPVSSVHWRGGDSWNMVGARKAFRVDTLEELQKEYERVSSAHADVLVQEWIPGPADQIVVIGAYVNQDSNPLAYFTARKLVQSPEDFGTGCVVESLAIPELLPLTLRLWRRLDYQGMAEVEYKRDPRSGQFKLIEINARHWDWHRLGRGSGVNLSWVAYSHLTGQAIMPSHRPIVRMKWIAEDALLLHCARAVYRREPGLFALWQHLSGRRMYGIFAWNDPIPFLRYVITVLIPSLVKTVLTKLQGRTRSRS
jgi:D-aspartate ligase